MSVERLKCSNTQCEYLVATNSEKMGSFCCKKCHMHFRGECRKLKHGGLCEKAEAPAELPRAPVVDPKEPLTQGQELPPKKNGKSGKKRNRSEGYEWNEPVAEEPAGIWSGMSPADQQNMLNRARRRMKKRAPAGHYTRRIRDGSPVTDAESSVSSRRDGHERAGQSRSRSRKSRRSRKSVEHGRARAGHADLRDASNARPGSPMIPAEGAHQLRTCPPRPRGSVGASMAASHRDAMSHDEKSWLARRNRTRSSDRSHPPQGGSALVAVKKEQIESPPRRRRESREDREWSRTRHGHGGRRLAPGQVFDAFRERSPWSAPLRRRRRARADSDSEYTVDSELSIVTSYTVFKEEAPAPPSTSQVSGAEGQPEASSLCLKELPRSEGKLEALWQTSLEVHASAQAAAVSKDRKPGRGGGTSAPDASRGPARQRDRRPPKKKKIQAVESSGSYSCDYSYYSDSDSAPAKDKRASK